MDFTEHGRDAPTVYHGGNLTAARQMFPLAPKPWIDLSTGINPFAYPIPALPEALWTRLPEPSDLADLERVAAARYGVPPDAEVVAAPGTQALIQHLPLIGTGRVGILGVTYGEYAQVWRDAEPRIVSSPAGLAGCDVAVIVNPNNPDGRLIGVAELRALAGQVGLLVIDEAFMDLLPPGSSLIPDLPVGNTLVLRSFGKTYGLAGVRLGFAVTAPRLADRLRSALGPWPVSGPAIAIGRVALADHDWLARTIDDLAPRVARIDRTVEQRGFRVIGGTALFRLVAHPAASDCHRYLGERGILVRDFPAHPTWLRLGLPPNPEAEARLATALAGFASWARQAGLENRLRGR